jgi:glycerophosphoryl diester phosphodiesterase
MLQSETEAILAHRKEALVAMDLLRARTGRLLLVAHRGASGRAPENTIAAFDLAAELGADVVELDVCFTRDLAPIVIHPAAFADLSNVANPISEMSLVQFDRIYSSISTSNPRLTFPPRLTEVLEWARGRVGVILDIKDTRRVALCHLTDLVDRYGPHNEVIVSSYDPCLLHEAKTRLPAISTSILIKNTNGPFDRGFGGAFSDPCIDIVHTGSWNLSPSIVQTAHENGKAICSWNIDTPGERELAERFRLDLGVTSFPLI